MPGFIKICGIRDAETAVAAAAAGASHLGFVFFPKSPRFIDAAAAEDIVTEVKRAAFDQGFDAPGFVGLFVDAGERALAEAAPFLTHFQFHGRESPERCAAMGRQFGLGVIKAVPVGAAEDAAGAAAFADAADMILFDARPPRSADRPGGHGAAFDWALLRAYEGETPFALAGGLAPDTVAAAVAAVKGLAGFEGVDVSSGVESAPGVKDARLIAAFVAAAKAAF
ncbi:phosphoribosylanthranilate isomerase [Amphiplicatus metriothermophilus]|uniref:N-(5'-phosphoribosyl)anthranilate isomerase n=1 Tax=Amphiplicatus metriothermophilus TaxID=1519374 RepID=A0A239PLE6_9PROT|nr:phosphoribosylanthranilate isomerase [Amphiplicatus metriothermophilus]MBB5517506.1 phosphoribosylanthranilate isomerase [Amphiplicatus metriothermophilus]SNT68159.1 phosphoribosylanthranilate isomerase [Amphiplicatus metriothermophilus]